MKSAAVILFAAGLVSAVAVPAQLAEREALQPLPEVQPREVAHGAEKRAVNFAHLAARQEAAPAQATPSEGQAPPAEAQPTPTQSQVAQESVNPSESAPPTATPTGGQTDGNKDPNQNGNKDSSQNRGGKNGQKGNKDNNNNNNNNKDNNKDNNRNNKELNQLIEKAIRDGSLLQGLFTAAITDIIKLMGLSQNVNLGVIQGLNFGNQIVVLNQLQQLQNLMQFNIVQRQQVVTLLGQGFSNNGVNIAILKRGLDEFTAAVEEDE